MNRTAASSLAGFAFLLVTAATVPAAVPSPANSTLPDCMVLCPLGDIPFTVVVRDLGNIPIAGSTVVLDLSGCPAASICPYAFPAYTTDLAARTLTLSTDASGTATFPAHVGGIGPAGCAKVFADGILLRSYALASPDQDGNGFTVNLYDTGDVPPFTAKLGTADPTADLDCDGGLVDAGDEAIFYRHDSQYCLGFVDPVQHRSWGALKQHYR